MSEYKFRCRGFDNLSINSLLVTFADDSIGFDQDVLFKHLDKILQDKIEVPYILESDDKNIIMGGFKKPLIGLIRNTFINRARKAIEENRERGFHTSISSIISPEFESVAPAMLIISGIDEDDYHYESYSSSVDPIKYISDWIDGIAKIYYD